MIIINNISNINLKDTITCGQIFRFEIEDNDLIILIFNGKRFYQLTIKYTF